MRVTQTSAASTQKHISCQRQAVQARGGTVVARSTKDASAAQPVSNGLLAFVQKSMAGAGAAVMLLNGPAPSFAEEFEVSAAQTTFEVEVPVSVSSPPDDSAELVLSEAPALVASAVISSEEESTAVAAVAAEAPQANFSKAFSATVAPAVDVQLVAKPEVSAPAAAAVAVVASAPTDSPAPVAAADTAAEAADSDAKAAAAIETQPKSAAPGASLAAVKVAADVSETVTAAATSAASPAAAPVPAAVDLAAPAQAVMDQAAAVAQPAAPTPEAAGVKAEVSAPAKAEAAAVVKLDAAPAAAVESTPVLKAEAPAPATGEAVVAKPDASPAPAPVPASVSAPAPALSEAPKPALANAPVAPAAATATPAAAVEAVTPTVATPPPVLAASTSASSSSSPDLSFSTSSSSPAVIQAAPAPEPAAELTVLLPVPTAEMPASALPDLVSALVSNEQFLAALVNNEAFLDRLAGDDAVVLELERRKPSTSAAAAREALASELVRRQRIMDVLVTRGPEAVMAVADSARAVLDAVGPDGPVGPEGLVKLETAMELLEDSEELMMAVEGKDMGATLAYSGEQRFRAMEGRVAATEKELEATLASQPQLALAAEHDLQAAVKELFATSDAVSEEALEEAREVVGPSQVQARNAAASVAADDEILNAYDNLVVAVAQLQRAYGNAVGDALNIAEQKLVRVEDAAAIGVEKTRVLVAEKTAELEADVEQITSVVAAVVPPQDEVQRDALLLEVGALLFILYQAYRMAGQR